MLFFVTACTSLPCSDCFQ